MLKLNKKDFMNALKFAIECAPKKDVRYYLNSVLLNVHSDSVRIVSTDGYRLSVVTLEVEYVPFELINERIIIERGSVEQLIKVFKVAGNGSAGEKVEQLELRFEDVLKVVDEGLEINLKVVEGKYPDFDRLISGKPFGNGSVESIGFDANYLSSAAKMFKVMMKSMNETALKLDFTDSSGLTRFTLSEGVRSCGQLKDAVMYLMPCRV